MCVYACNVMFRVSVSVLEMFECTHACHCLASTHTRTRSHPVTRGWNAGWESALASSENIAVASVDGAGTGARGIAFQHQIYRELGVKESDDQIAAAKWLSNLACIDEKRVMIWGWSYGGFMSSTLATRNLEGVFAATASVAPVTSWLWYDSVYTERYMSLPQLNPDGYEQTAVIGNVGLISKPFFLAHGLHGECALSPSRLSLALLFFAPLTLLTSHTHERFVLDDNVHYQHSAFLQMALNAADVPFEQMVFANRDHSLAGRATRRALYEKLTRFVKSSFGMHQKSEYAAEDGSGGTMS
jgi:dipeptidyl-peptidase-4